MSADLRQVPRLRRAARRLVAATAAGTGSIIRVDTPEPAVALTFDDGPHPEDTPPLLDLLARHGARATFFMVGKSARRWPGLVRQVAEAGHAVGNHTWDHSSFRLISGRFRRAQLAWCREALAPHGAPLFRPPYGEQGLGARLDARRLGYDVVCWDAIAEDWRDDPAEVMVARVMRRLEPGSIVLFHDTLYTTVEERFRDRRPMRQAVEALLVRLGERYRFVTVPELLALGRPVRWHWYRRAHLDWIRQVE